MKKLQIVHCALVEPPHLTHIKDTLYYLHLEDNNISKIPYNYFEGCKCLGEVYLTENELIAVPYLGFIHRTLQILDLSRNKIQNVYWLYNKLTALYSVKLASNLIHSICMQPRSIWLSLSSINLNNNNLTSFYLPSGDGRVVDLYENPFHCDEKLGWTHRCQRSISGFSCGTFIIDDVYGMLCASPSQWSGVSPLDAGKSLVFTFFLLKGTGYTSIVFKIWISDYIHTRLWDIITHSWRYTSIAIWRNSAHTSMGFCAVFIILDGNIFTRLRHISFSKVVFVKS